MHCFVIGFLLFCFMTATAQEPVPLIPYPAKLVADKGSFVVSPATTLQVSANARFENEVKQLGDLLANSFGKSLLQNATAATNQIRLRYDESLTTDEAYKISVTPQRVILSAKSPVGMFRAVQTIRQLLPHTVEKESRQEQLQLPVIEIEDAPSFAWRGVHLDVSRHFFSLDYLKKLIDLMALYKLNKFHLHLTDDQGWRMEIKKYPKLTEEGAWRTFNKQDSVCMERAKEDPDFIIDPKHIVQKAGKQVYGGFYTQEQLKDLVAFAAGRHVEIIPEIDMPGHMMAAINAYTYLSCDSTSAFGKLFSTPICPCRPETVQFAKDIFTEVMAIFPSPYIHIGGDEVDRSFWEGSPACRELMKKEGLKNAAELQAWFIRQMEDFFRAHGKKLIGWDEILEGGISQSATVMYWRTWVPNAPIKAAKNGNPVIMTPGNPLYFSEQPDRNSLPAVYHYEVIPKQLSPLEAKKIIGGQANVWTEYVPTEQRADYLYMPRLTALAEILWTGKRDYPSYLHRLTAHYKRLDDLNVSYRLPDLDLLNEYAFADSTSLSVKKPIDNLVIRYTLNGSTPTAKSPELTRPLLIRTPQSVRLAAFSSTGRRGDVYDVSFNKQSPARAVNVQIAGEGLTATWYKRAFDSTKLISGVPDGKFTVSNFLVPEVAKGESFSLQYRGYLDVPQAGVYTFFLTSDDASVLKIAGRQVVNNDGMHAPKEKNGQAVLQKGLHPVELDFIEGGGGYTLKLQYSLNGSAPKEIPAGWLKH